MIKPGIYRHFKGNLYEVIGEATHSETDEVMVVYRKLYPPYTMNVRPVEMFTETVDKPEYNHLGPRFTLEQEF